MDNKLNSLDSDINKIVINLKNELGGIRTNSPSTKLVEDLLVDAYNQKTPIKQLGSISVLPPRTIQITVWDSGVANAVAKAIESSNLGVNANVQGNTIHLNLPALTEERRQEMVKLVKTIIEKHRIAIRSARDDYNKKIKAAFDKKEISEDDKFNLLAKIQENIDQVNKEVDSLLESKIVEIKE